MSEENKTTHNDQQMTTPTSEENGGRMFTQEDVNRIVGERLARAKKDAGLADQEQALKAREARLDCREYLVTHNHPAELLDILDSSDAEVFKANVEKIQKLFGHASSTKSGAVTFDWTAPITGAGTARDPIADAFKPKI